MTTDFILGAETVRSLLFSKIACLIVFIDIYVFIEYTSNIHQMFGVLIRKFAERGNFEIYVSFAFFVDVL